MDDRKLAALEEYFKTQDNVPGLCNRGMELVAQVRDLQHWVNDLQSGMYINCVYCGHRYGPSETTAASMADVLKKHVEQCPKHPMSALKKRVAALRRRVAKLEVFRGTVARGHRESNWHKAQRLDRLKKLARKLEETDGGGAEAV